MVKVLGGGEIRKGNLIGFVNPMSKLWKNVTAARVIMGSVDKANDHNFNVSEVERGRSSAMWLDAS